MRYAPGTITCTLMDVYTPVQAAILARDYLEQGERHMDCGNAATATLHLAAAARYATAAVLSLELNS